MSLHAYLQSAIHVNNNLATSSSYMIIKGVDSLFTRTRIRSFNIFWLISAELSLPLNIPWVCVGFVFWTTRLSLSMITTIDRIRKCQHLLDHEYITYLFKRIRWLLTWRLASVLATFQVDFMNPWWTSSRGASDEEFSCINVIIPTTTLYSINKLTYAVHTFRIT